MPAVRPVASHRNDPIPSAQARGSAATVAVSTVPSPSVARATGPVEAGPVEGALVEAGPVGTLFKEPLHPYTRGLLHSVPRIGRRTKGGRLEEIPGQVPRPGELPAGCAFHPRCPDATERCIGEQPRLKAEQPGHAVSCWLYPEAP